MKLPPGAYLDGESARFQYRNADGKVDVTRLRKLPSEIAAAGLPVTESAPLLARAHSLLERVQRPERDVAMTFEARAAEPTAPLDILMNGAIGAGLFSEGITAAGVQRALSAAPGRDVRVRINSPGGDAFEGGAIHNVLAQSGRQITVEVIGQAASAASVVAMAASPGKLRVAKNGVVMIHNSWGTAVGGAEVHEQCAAALRAINEGMASIYASRTRRSTAEITSWMAKETYMAATRALELGFADEIMDAVPGAAAQACAQLAPDDTELRAMLQASDQTGHTNTMDPKQIRAKLGLSETATEAEVMQALDRAVAQGAPKPPAASAPAPGAVVLSPEVLAAVQAAVVSSTGAATASQAHVDACNAAVERFIAARKIRPADRDKALKACGDTAASLTATVDYWTAAPELLPQQREPKVETSNDPTSGFSPMLKLMQKSAGVKPETLQSVIAEGH